MTKENSKAQSKRLKWFENKLEYLIGILLPVIIIIFSTTSFFKGTENSVYDMMLHVSPGSEKVEVSCLSLLLPALLSAISMPFL